MRYARSAVVWGLLLALVAPACADGLTAAEIAAFNRMSPTAYKLKLGDKLHQALTTLAARPTTLTYPFTIPGNLGHDAGPGSDGVLIGALTDTAAGYAYLFGQAEDCLAYACDGGAYTAQTTAANNATTNDVTLVPATGVQNDAYYFGHATDKFGRLDISITTQGNFSGTVAWEYWDGTAYSALDDVTDGTTNFNHATGTVSVTFDVPEDWERNTVDGVLGYWVRGRLSAVTSGGGALASRVYAIVEAASGTWTDDTTDFNDADAGDVALLPAKAVQGDAFYIGADTQFCKLKSTLSQARANGTIAIEYSKASTWGTLTCADNSTGFSAGTSTYITSWAPPSDWAKQTVNGQSAYWVRVRLATEGVTTQPLLTRGYVKDLTHGDGVGVNGAVTLSRFQACAMTASASNADSKFLIINLTQGSFASATWTKADVCDAEAISLGCADGDKIALVQVAEDGSTEFANANIILDAD